MINGTKIQISCNPITTTAQQVFEAVIKFEQLQENFFLGLCALVGGDFVFLPKDLKIYKVRRTGIFCLILFFTSFSFILS